MIRRIFITLLLMSSVGFAGIGIASYLDREEWWKWKSNTFELKLEPRHRGTAVTANLVWVLDALSVYAYRGQVRVIISTMGESSVLTPVKRYALGPLAAGWGHTGPQFSVPDPPPVWAETPEGHRSLLFIHSYYWIGAPFWVFIMVMSAYPLISIARNWRRKWRSKKFGLCKSCGHDLTGNVSGVCPECGQAAAESGNRERPDA